MRNNTFVIFAFREWRLLFRNTSALVQPFGFFLIIAFLFPLSLPAENNLLQRIGGGVIWVSVVLATLMSLENMFRSDYQDGCIEQWLIQPRSLSAAILGKVFAHWSCTGLLLAILSPVLGIIFGLPLDQLSALFLSLLIGTPSLSLIGAIGAALTVSLNRGGILQAIIILPLFIPIIVFGAGMMTHYEYGANLHGQIYALTAIAVLTITLAPFAVASALRITIN